MNVNDLKAKVTAAEEKVHKCENTIERHKKSLDKYIKIFNDISVKHFGITYEEWTTDAIRDTDVREIYWSYCDIKHKEDDIKGAIKKLEDAEKVYNNWVEKLNKEEARQAYIEDSIPDIIKDFLNEWKAQTIKFMQGRRDKFKTDYEQYKIDRNYCYYSYIVDHRNHYTYIDERFINEFDKDYNYSNHINYGEPYRAVRKEYDLDKIESAFKAKYSDALFANYKSSNFDDEWLEKVIEQEKNNKLIDLMERVTKITGVITDASNLHINKGELNGTIIGEKGAVSVTTIGAGGYNIQRYHFRTLIHKLMKL